MTGDAGVVEMWVGADLAGTRGSPTRAPRLATPGEISDQRSATPRNPGRPARPGPDICQMPGPARTFVKIGTLACRGLFRVSRCTARVAEYFAEFAANPGTRVVTQLVA